MLTKFSVKVIVKQGSGRGEPEPAFPNSRQSLVISRISVISIPNTALFPNSAARVNSLANSVSFVVVKSLSRQDILRFPLFPALYFGQIPIPSRHFAFSSPSRTVFRSNPAGIPRIPFYPGKTVSDEANMKGKVSREAGITPMYGLQS